jgi:hypothetical protein
MTLNTWRVMPMAFSPRPAMTSIPNVLHPIVERAANVLNDSEAP